MALRTSDADTFLREVVVLRRRIAILRRGLAPHRWAFAPLARPDFELEGLGKPWPGIMDRLETALDAVENARELLIGAFDVYMATSAQRTNDVMKTLTILSAILLPAVVLAGVMGMNFEIGFFDTRATSGWPWGHAVAGRHGARHLALARLDLIGRYHRSMASAQLNEVAGWLAHASHVVALTGAGISTESGIPDFRGRRASGRATRRPRRCPTSATTWPIRSSAGAPGRGASTIRRAARRRMPGTGRWPSWSGWAACSC